MFGFQIVFYYFITTYVIMFIIFLIKRKKLYNSYKWKVQIKIIQDNGAIIDKQNEFYDSYNIK